MTAIIEAIVWFSAGTAAGLSIGLWLRQRMGDYYTALINDLLAASHHLRARIDELQKKRERGEGEEWKDQ